MLLVSLLASSFWEMHFFFQFAPALFSIFLFWCFIVYSIDLLLYWALCIDVVLLCVYLFPTCAPTQDDDPQSNLLSAGVILPGNMIASLLSAPYTFIIDSLLYSALVHSLHKKRSKRRGETYMPSSSIAGPSGSERQKHDPPRRENVGWLLFLVNI